MIIRKVKKNDYRNITLLFIRNKLEFMCQLTWENLWNNPYLNRKKNKNLGWVLVFKKKIVGHIGYYPSIYLYKNNKISCSVLHGWVVDKKFRTISISLIQKYLSTKNDFFLGTTNNKHAGSIMKSFSFSEVPSEGLNSASLIILNPSNFLKYYFRHKNIIFKQFLIYSLSYILNLLMFKNINKWKKIKVKNKIYNLKNFDKNFQNFCQKYKKNNSQKLHLTKTPLWLNWFLKVKIKNKNIIISACKKGKKIVGYSILFIKNKQGFKTAHLVDLISLSEDNQFLIDLTKHNINLAYKKGCNFFDYRNASLEKRKILKPFSAIEIKLKYNSFYYKSNNDKINNILKKSDTWDPSSLDGDILLN